MRLAVILLALSTSAHAATTAITLRDGAHRRQIIRLGPADARGLAPVRWRDLDSGLDAPAFVGKDAVLQLDGDPLALARRLGFRLLRPLMPSLRLWLVESASDEDGLELAARLQAQFDDLAINGSVTQALPDLYLPRVHTDTLDTTPNDPRYPGQWFWPLLGMESAWHIESGRATVEVVVVDDGCDGNHPDLVDKLGPGKDVVDGDNDPSFAPGISNNSHGTSCAGLVAASTNNGIGIAGACPGCRMRCVRLLSPSGLVPTSADVDTYQFVLDVNAAVASNSWGFKDPTPVPQPLADAIGQVYDHGRGGLGALVVFAAGNDSRLLGADELNAVRGVITVGAVNNFGELAQFSNFGPSVAVVAPTGTSTTDISGPDGSDPGDYTSSFGGTSSACPIVAGVLGLMVSAAPDKTAAELTAVLVGTAKQSLFATPDAAGHDDQYGFGLIQPAVALRQLVPLPPPPPPPKAGCACDVGGAHRDDTTPVIALGILTLLLGLHRAYRRTDLARGGLTLGD